MNNLYQQLKSYWDILPKRLEEYEKSHNILSSQYISLKREYIRLSLRIWLTSRNIYENCPNSTYFPILYFYSINCKYCIDQGVEFDIIKGYLKKNNITLLVFPIDADFEEDAIYFLKEYYNINSLPALIIKDKVYQGRLFKKEELTPLIESS